MPAAKRARAEDGGLAGTPTAEPSQENPAAGVAWGSLRGPATAGSAKAAAAAAAPLAERMRPRDLGELVGQEDSFGPETPLASLIRADRVPSLVLWGPPGCGKTSIARCIASSTKRAFAALSAVQAGVKQVRDVTTAAAKRLEGRLGERRATVLFLDEIHRFNKAQQDSLLPHVEAGTVTLIGATTENPSFSLNGALLSRCRVVMLKRLTPEHIASLLRRAVDDRERGARRSLRDPERTVRVDGGVVEFLAHVADGDARQALTALDIAVQACDTARDAAGAGEGDVLVTMEAARAALQRSGLLYDRGGEEHYNVISALHKSMRGGDASASLYWLARMLEAGEPPRYVARRVMQFAAEDVGLADPAALPLAVAAAQAAHMMGMPECELCLAEAVACECA